MLLAGASQLFTPTLGHHALQVDDVGMVKLGHDAGFAQEIPTLLLCVTGFQRFDSHWPVPFPW